MPWMSFWLTRQPFTTVTLEGARIKLRSSRLSTKFVDLAMATGCLIDKQYAPPVWDIPRNATIIDIGGHIGSFTLSAAKQAPEGKIFTFEPEADNFALLTENITLNHIDNIHAFNLAVSESNDRKTFYRDPLNSAESGFFKKTGTMFEVEAITLAKIFEENNIEMCQLLKIDCEGSEYEILFGLPLSILSRIEKISMEVHNPAYYGISNLNHTPQKLMEYLRKQGFHLWEKKENKMHSLVFADRGISQKS